LHKRDVVFVTACARVKRSQVKISSHPLPTGPIFKRGTISKAAELIW